VVAIVLWYSALVFVVVLAVLAAAAVLLQPTIKSEEGEKELLERLLIVFCDYVLPVPGAHAHVFDHSMHRTRLIKNYLQRRNLLEGLFDETCRNYNSLW
jgi:hypothetical protein